jgi:hypothetical protein
VRRVVLGGSAFRLSPGLYRRETGTGLRCHNMAQHSALPRGREEIMRKGGYHGGSTVVQRAEDGTWWAHHDEAAQSKRVGSTRSRNDHYKTSSKREIELEIRREAEERRLLRGFISNCAAAYRLNKLTASEPTPPRRVLRPLRNPACPQSGPWRSARGTIGCSRRRLVPPIPRSRRCANT